METSVTTTSESLTSSCPKHYYPYVSCSAENCSKTKICKVCACESKEDVQHMHDHFDFIKFEDPQIEEFTKDLKDFEGYEELNKILKESLVNCSSSIEEIFTRVNNAKQMIIDQLREGTLIRYNAVTDEFESIVKDFSKQVDSINLKDNSTKQEIKRMKSELEIKTNLLSNHNDLLKEFNSIVEKAKQRILSMTLQSLAEKKFNFSAKVNHLSTHWRNGSSTVTTAYRGGGSYWCEKSKEILSGPFTCKVKVVRINPSTAVNAWSFTIGIIRANSTNDGSYYNDSIALMSTGSVTAKFSGSGGSQLFTTWKNGDEIIIKLDEEKKLYFGVNDESQLKLAYPDVSGSFNIVLGILNGAANDTFEMTELYAPY